MEPDSVLVVVLLVLVACALIAMVIRLRRLPLRLVSGALALMLAAVSGIACVNIYYGYYQTWGQLSADLTGSYTNFASAPSTSRDLGPVRRGTVRRVTFAGRLSRISRPGFVYLPPQYDQPSYAHVRFPVVELLHGSPGTPENWIQQIDVESIMNQLIARRLVGPMVVVMPSIDDGNRFEDCTDAPGALDDTYITRDVADDVRAQFRVTRESSEWGIGGYSSGGYCAANLAMRHRGSFGAAGILDGYFRPIDGPAAAALHHNAAAEASNDPLRAAQRLSVASRPLPAFWISSGTAEPKYVIGAKIFVRALKNLQQVNYTVEPGAGHNFYTWRPAIPRMLAWMWQQIAPPSLRVQFPIAGPVQQSSLQAPQRHSHHRG